MRKFIFLPPARYELLSALRFYEGQATGLGLAFLSEVERCIELIVQHPQVGPTLGGDTRRQLVRRFPFGVLYRIGKDEITVVAVMHLRRKPDYWRDR